MEAGTLTAPPAARPLTWTRVPTAAALGAVAVVDVALRFGAFGRVRPNPFYDAAVRSMSQSWHNFFFGAFDPAGQLSIDKAPADLWLQVASVKLFGFNSIALRLPEAVGGAVAVLLLYDLVRRLFGRGAGLASALVLAVLPISVITARSDTMDSVMMALLVAAAWLVVVGAQSGRRGLVIAAGATAGLAFNVKLFESLVALPALACLTLLLLDGPVRRRMLTIAGSGVAMVTVSLAWIGTASLTHVGGRPWPIGSLNGSIWDVVFRYNGTARLDQGTYAGATVDPVGMSRLFGPRYGPYIGTVLVGAVVFGALAAVVARTGRGLGDQIGAAQTKARRAGAVFIGVWLGTGLIFFSQMQRLRGRYLEAMTPAVAAALGVGLAMLATASLRNRRSAACLAAGAVLIAVAAPRIGPAPGSSSTFALVGAAAAVAAAAVAGLVGPLRGRVRPALVAGALVATLAVPLAFATRMAQTGASDSGHLGASPASELTLISHFLQAHRGGARYEVASASPVAAASLIAHDGQPVLMLTSWAGQPAMTAAQLAHRVRTGQVRYLLAPPPSSARSARVLRWAARHGRDVSRAAGLPRTGMLTELHAGQPQGAL